MLLLEGDIVITEPAFKDLYVKFLPLLTEKGIFAGRRPGYALLPSAFFLARYFFLIYLPAVLKLLEVHPLVFLVVDFSRDEDSFLLLRLQQK